MNFLAHAQLSFHQPEILVGNMISDFVKGKKQYDYSPGIQQGIKLHRAIDQFTDTHPVTKELKQYFRSSYGLYAGVFTDVMYDYFLANDTQEFASAEVLQQFSAGCYHTLETYDAVLPASFKKIFGYMRSQDWLFHYHEKWLIEKSFWGLERRAKYLKETGQAFIIFNEHLDELHLGYDVFYPQLKDFAVHTLQKLLKH